MKTLQTILNPFLVLWSAPQTPKSTEEAMTIQSGTLPKAIHGGFLPNLQKTRFFIQNEFKKRLQRLFWWTLHYVAEL